MRIRNARQYDMYLPYAGKKKGFAVSAGKLSMELPTDRFYDTLLQRDWKLGKIEVFLNDTDKEVLGPVADDLTSELVDVSGDSVTPVEDPNKSKGATADKETTDAVEKKARRKRGRRAKRRDEKPGIKSIKATSNGVRLYDVAKKLGVTPRSMLAEMRRRGMQTTGSAMNLGADVVAILEEHFSGKPPKGAIPPKLNVSQVSGRMPTRGSRITGSAHEVPFGVPGMPTVPPESGAPSLADLQARNAQINLGQPKFNNQPGVPKATIEKPTSNLFGSALNDGVPKANNSTAGGE
jgi:hypothetical protein